MVVQESLSFTERRLQKVEDDITAVQVQPTPP